MDRYNGVGYNEFLRISPAIKIAWIMGRRSFQIEKRAKDMNIGYLVQSCAGKNDGFGKILKETGFKTSETIYMGDDIIRLAGLSVLLWMLAKK
jgi:3-deoxy-D-manno-octulosonate 8-phosphate phosphatase (KDO 8-P phosphatase)